MTELTRRNVLTTASAVPVALAAGEVRAESALPKLKYSTPAENVRAFLKLHASLATETVFYTYAGTLEAMVPGQEIVNLVSTTTLIRRDVEVVPEGHRILVWEGTVYHRPGESEALDEFENPLNGRTVRPFHQREGRGEALWTDDGPSFRRHDGEWVSRYGPHNPYKLDWHQAGERIWMSRYSSGVYAKHPLNAEEWPLEYVGPDLLYSEKTTNNGLIREMADPSIVNASSTYSMSVGMLWWPWLMMGQTPGHLVWNTNGAKLSSLDTIPDATRQMIESVHPYLFKSGAPWEGRYSLWTDYPKMRKPVLEI
ncbi:MAG: DUF1838 family protein [Rhodospirillaceae bacterium]